LPWQLRGFLILRTAVAKFGQTLRDHSSELDKDIKVRLVYDIVKLVDFPHIYFKISSFTESQYMADGAKVAKYEFGCSSCIL
jgi:hypothetical protein